MVEYGVTIDGFVIKPYEVILNEMKVQAKAQFGQEIDLTDTSPLLKFLESTALELFRVWESAESLYYSGYIDTATGTSLDRVVKLIGVIRIPATKATGEVTFTGTNDVTVPVGIRVSTNTGVVFVTTEEGVVAGGSVDIDVEAEEYGDEGNVTATSITTLIDNITGISSISNAAPTTGGEDVESDSELRLRAALSLEGLGKATLAAIEAAVLAIPGVTKVTVTENTTTHSVEVVLKGLTPPDSDVDDAIDDTRAAGIAATWKNPTPITIYIDTTVACTNEPADAATQVENMILAYISGLEIGDDVIYSKLYDIIFNQFSWVDDVTALTLDTITPPVGTSNIVIAYDEEAETDAAKVGVTIT